MKSIQDFLDEYRDKLRGDRHSQEADVDLKPGVVIQNPEGQEGLDSESDFSSDQLSQKFTSPPTSEDSRSSKKAHLGLDDVLSDSLPHHLGAVRSKLGHAFQKIEEVYQQQMTRLVNLQDQLRGVQSEIEKVHKIRVTADTLVRLLKLATQKKRVVDSLDERRVSLEKEVKALQQKHQQDETSWRDFVFDFQKKKERYEQEEQLIKQRLIEKKHQYQVDYDQRYKDLDMELEKRRSEFETELIQKQAEQERANHEKHLRFEEECKNKLTLFTEHQHELEEKIIYQKNYFSEKEKLLHDRHRDFSQLESKLSDMKQDIQVHLKEKEKEVTDRLVTRYDHMMANTKSQYEQELFGEEKENGSISYGALEKANGGTLLIDQVSEIPLDIQSKILRVLTDQKFKRVNGSSDVSVDVRLICSSSKDLKKEIEIGNFREDLFHRINVFEINVEPLSQRISDIPLLIKYFSKMISENYNISELDIDENNSYILNHNWKGNVRELRNLIERIAILQPETKDKISNIIKESLKNNNFDDQIAENSLSVPLKEAREKFEKEYLTIQLKKFNGNISKTASFVGMERSALHRKLKGLGIKEFN